MTLITGTTGDLGLKSGTSSGRAWHSCQEPAILRRFKAPAFPQPVGLDVRGTSGRSVWGTSGSPRFRQPPPRLTSLQNRVFSAYYIPTCSPVLPHLSKPPQTSDFLLFPRQQRAGEGARLSHVRLKARRSALACYKAGKSVQGHKREREQKLQFQTQHTWCRSTWGALLGHSANSLLHPAPGSPWGRAGDLRLCGAGASAFVGSPDVEAVLACRGGME